MRILESLQGVFSKPFWRVIYLSGEWLQNAGKCYGAPLRGDGKRFQGVSSVNHQQPGFAKANWPSMSKCISMRAMECLDDSQHVISTSYLNQKARTQHTPAINQSQWPQSHHICRAGHPLCIQGCRSLGAPTGPCSLDYQPALVSTHPKSHTKQHNNT